MYNVSIESYKWHLKIYFLLIAHDPEKSVTLNLLFLLIVLFIHCVEFGFDFIQSPSYRITREVRRFNIELLKNQLIFCLMIFDTIAKYEIFNSFNLMALKWSLDRVFVTTTEKPTRLKYVSNIYRCEAEQGHINNIFWYQ